MYKSEKQVESQVNCVSKLSHRSNCFYFGLKNLGSYQVTFTSFGGETYCYER